MEEYYVGFKRTGTAYRLCGHGNPIPVCKGENKITLGDTGIKPEENATYYPACHSKSTAYTDILKQIDVNQQKQRRLTGRNQSLISSQSLPEACFSLPVSGNIPQA